MIRRALLIAGICLLCFLSGFVGALVGARAACLVISAFLDERLGVFFE